MSYPRKNPISSTSRCGYTTSTGISAFFREVLGMPLRECDGPTDNPARCGPWGVQLVATPGFEAPPSNAEGWLALRNHGRRPRGGAEGSGQLGRQGAAPLGPNWLQLPDGLALELMQATGNAVAEVLAVDPRA